MGRRQLAAVGNGSLILLSSFQSVPFAKSFQPCWEKDRVYAGRGGGHSYLGIIGLHSRPRPSLAQTKGPILQPCFQF